MYSPLGFFWDVGLHSSKVLKKIIVLHTSKDCRGHACLRAQVTFIKQGRMLVNKAVL